MKGGRHTFILCSALLLTSCLYRETSMTPNRIQLVEKADEQDYLTSEMTDARVADIADHHEHHGNGPLEITVTYDPLSSVNTARRASDQAALLFRTFSENRTAANVNVLPVNGQGDVSHTYVYYKSIDALPPPGCTELFDGTRNTGATSDDYGFGCTIETAVSRQVSRPADLAGRKDDSAGDAQRQDAIVDTYRSGKPNAVLPAASSD